MNTMLKLSRTNGEISRNSAAIRARSRTKRLIQRRALAEGVGPPETRTISWRFISGMVAQYGHVVQSPKIIPPGDLTGSKLDIIVVLDTMDVEVQTDDTPTDRDHEGVRFGRSTSDFPSDR
jgi:hypothetical protein